MNSRTSTTEAIFFKSPGALRRWLRENQAGASELLIGFYKKASARHGITYAEALDQALCFGWIDGVRRSLGETSYTIRFTPRKPKSAWSLVNTKRYRQLARLGLVEPAGRAAFGRRDPEQTKRYSYESRPHKLDACYERVFRRHRGAWRFFEAQPPSYRRSAAYWIASAKKEETRRRRLERLIEDSARGQRLAVLSGKKPK